MPTRAQAVYSADDIGQAVGYQGKLSYLDSTLLRCASNRMTLQQISEEIGGVLTPAQCGQRVREILKSYDWMSDLDQRGLILMDFIELKNILFDRVRSEGGTVRNEDGSIYYSFGDPRWAAALTKVLEQLSKLVSREQPKLDAERQMLRRAHAKVMIEAVELAFRKLTLDIRESYPEVDEMVLRGFLETALPSAIQAIEARAEVEG